MKCHYQLTFVQYDEFAGDFLPQDDFRPDGDPPPRVHPPGQNGKPSRPSVEEATLVIAGR